MEDKSFLEPILLDCSKQQLEELAKLLDGIIVPNVVPLFKMSDFTKEATVRITSDENDSSRFKWSISWKD